MKTMLITVALATCVALEGSAMPTKEEAERAEPVVRKLMAPERAALESGKKTRSEVAAAAMKLADEADTAAAKLLLMKGAFVLYVRDGNLEKAVETMNTIEKAIADVPPQCVTNMIETALLGVPDKKIRLYQFLADARSARDSRAHDVAGRAREVTSTLMGTKVNSQSRAIATFSPVQFIVAFRSMSLGFKQASDVSLLFAIRSLRRACML